MEQSQASKSSFLAAASQHRYLHLATHGFFVQDEPLAPVLSANSDGSRLGEMLRWPEAGKMHPALLAGLALAGANRAGKPRTTSDPDAEDGILTAEEIGAVNLDGVQLVVLSACETGLGESAAGEGLLGLQRAFQIAGARTVVASLWKVPDEETKALMTTCYSNIWQGKLSTLESLRQAQLAMLRNDDHQAGRWRAPDFSQTVALPASSTAEKPEAVRRRRLSPAYWAAFVLSGDWR